LFDVKFKVNPEAFRKENLNLIDNLSEDTQVVFGEEIESDALGNTFEATIVSSSEKDPEFIIKIHFLEDQKISK
jgi:hypothetical protein